MKSVIGGAAPPSLSSVPAAQRRRERWQAMPAEELVIRCRRGEPAAFDALMRRHQRSIYKLAYQLAGNYDDAHEIVAETGLRIYRSIGTLQRAGNLQVWINRIVANVHLDILRHAVRHPAVSLEVLDEMTSESAINYQRSRFASPEAVAEESDRRRILNDAIASLPYYDRTMVTLFHRHGQKYEEIAEIMRMPLGTVKSRLHRARRALRVRLAPEESALVG